MFGGLNLLNINVLGQIYYIYIYYIVRLIWIFYNFLYEYNDITLNRATTVRLTTDNVFASVAESDDFISILDTFLIRSYILRKYLNLDLPDPSTVLLRNNTINKI